MDRLSALATFKAVVDHGGFARAAADLDVSCAKVSRTVQDLEMLLGVQLLQRTTRRVSLTSVGQQVLLRAVTLLDSYDELAALSSLSATEPSGVVRLAAPAAFARRLLGPALAEFMHLYPRVEVDLRTRDGLIDLFDDEVDVMLCLRNDLRESLIARRMGAAEVGVFAAPAYLARHGEPCHPDDLADHNCLTCDDVASGASWRMTWAEDSEVRDVPVRGSMRCSHADVVVGTALHGAGIALLPRFMVEEAVAQGGLKPLLRDWRCEPLPIQLAWGSRRNLPLSVRKLIDHLALALGGGDRLNEARPSPRMLAA
ncbi:LysR family transcriptional regulator [Rubrivivax sp. RP6-9]|uniref:LysR family transcriptional regulator n=1 Tax=Rubrivivax sp. RP6-9 TaxID=3415750 RepID=UPI003CC57107